MESLIFQLRFFYRLVQKRRSVKTKNSTSQTVKSWSSSVSECDNYQILQTLSTLYQTNTKPQWSMFLTCMLAFCFSNRQYLCLTMNSDEEKHFHTRNCSVKWAEQISSLVLPSTDDDLVLVVKGSQLLTCRHVQNQ